MTASLKAPVCQSCVGIYTEPPQLDGEVDQQSVAVCGVELSPDCTTMAVGCNDTQVAIVAIVAEKLRGQDCYVSCRHSSAFRRSSRRMYPCIAACDKQQ